MGRRMEGFRGRSPPFGGREPPKDPKYKPDWDCKECKISNFAKRTQCFRCKKLRDLVEVKYDKRGRKIGPNDWLCPIEKCGENNYSRRTECFRCKQPKPGSAVQQDGEPETQEDFDKMDELGDSVLGMADDVQTF